jgi:hypothetical protein
MKDKYKNLYLYLALACFLGIVLIFVFDGYLGVYDTIEINTGEYPQEIQPDYWLRGDTYWSAGIEWNDKADFVYEVDNRRFFGYSSNLKVSAWHENEKIADLVTREISASPFETWRIEWELDTSELIPPDASSELGYQFTLLIKRGDIERRIIINVSSEPKPPPPIR